MMTSTSYLVRTGTAGSRKHRNRVLLQFQAPPEIDVDRCCCDLCDLLPVETLGKRRVQGRKSWKIIVGQLIGLMVSITPLMFAEKQGLWLPYVARNHLFLSAPPCGRTCLDPLREDAGEVALIGEAGGQRGHSGD